MLVGCSKPVENEVKESENVVNTEYVKSVWITYYELKELLTPTAEEFKAILIDRFVQIKELGFNTITVQVRPFADAFYYSEIFPFSAYCNGIDYDPLSIICETANNIGLKVEAWINPYRVSAQNDIDSLPDNSPAKYWYYNDMSRNVYISKKGIFLNPAAQDVIDVITAGVAEIVQNYPVSAIHFDDYFYPTKNKDIDSVEYQNYKASGGDLSLSDWRRNNVTSMILAVNSSIKSINPNVKFGVSPAGNIDNDYKTLYADVELWASDNTYLDYICPQIYYGFKNEAMPFMFTTKKWVEITNVDLYIGLPLYKANTVDEFAGKGKNEFVNSHNIISRQIKYLSQIDNVKGYYIFSYSYLSSKSTVDEMKNIKDCD